MSGLLGLMFHHFHDDAGHPRIQGSVTADEFAALLQKIGIERFASPEEFEHCLNTNSVGAARFCITFDDSLRSQYDIARPVLDALGLKAYYFVYSSPFEGVVEPFEVHRYFRNIAFASVNEFYEAFYDEARQQGRAEDVDRALKSENARKYHQQFPFYSHEDRVFRYIRDVVFHRSEFDQVMAALISSKGFDVSTIAKRIWMDDSDLLALHRDGHSIGLHSYSHPTNFQQLSVEGQREEYERNMRHLSGLLGGAPTVMAHPSNSYSEATLLLLKRMGVTCGFRADNTQLEYSNLELPRVDHTVADAL